MSAVDVSHLAALIRAEIPLQDLTLGEQYRYASLTLCIIDAVFATGVRREAAENVVHRYCEYFAVPRLRGEAPAAPDTVTALVRRFEELGVEGMADTVFRNRQRTSTQNGILKAEAVRRFARELRDAGVEDFSTALAHVDDDSLDMRLKRIPGQHVSIGAFWMLAGTESCAKTTPAVYQFVRQKLGRRTSLPELPPLLKALLAELRTDRPDLTIQLLDYGIRSTQRRLLPGPHDDLHAEIADVETCRVAE
jgi:hypothetical protein